MDGQLPTDARVAVERILGSVEDITALSKSNNSVWRVLTAEGSYVVKVISDPTVDGIQEKHLLDRLGDTDVFRPILHVEQLPRNQYTLVIAPYIHGVSLDTLLSSGDYTDEQAAAWAHDLDRALRVLVDLPVELFGRPGKGNSPLYPRWTTFLGWYLERQRDKAKKLARLRYKALREVFDRLAPALDGAVPTPYMVPADVNARNLLVAQPQQRLKLVHMPVLWHADPAVPYGELLVHLHDTPILRHLLQRVDYPEWRLHFYAACSAYVILAYAERFDPLPLEEVCPWGRHRPLLQLLDQHLDFLSKAS